MASNITVPRILELAAIIGTAAAEINKTLTTQGIASPSFAEDAPETFPQEISDARDVVLDAAAELYDILLDPLTLLYQHGGHNNNICLQFISRYEIAQIVPAGGQVSFHDIGKQIKLPEQIVRRVLRHAMTMRVFHEPTPGMVAHTKTSKALQNSILNDWVKCGTQEMWPAAVKTLDAIEKWPDSSEPSETASHPHLLIGLPEKADPTVQGFSLANGTTDPIYAILGQEPERAVLFANAMKVYTIKPEYNVSHLLDNYDWASLGNSHVVDIGGSQGHIAVELAKRFSNLSITVQDIAPVVENSQCGIPQEIEGRVHFMAHDYFQPQAVEADVYFFRWVLHNLSDNACHKILRALIPVLKPGVRIILQDVCLCSWRLIPGLHSHVLSSPKDRHWVF
ncbi:S-adenosyl-L-methionine-dependent methyltransferase [Stachybotrys elegans]|uniref:S-adenosyl-L-methionine-dependent methyltransferase n=1 Tax=Stachybotrys elegans TaxID=80388 RepID=A0A8K0STG6_9HYPO|nr:S-adenosyl-L-methionine-dependent methyltransferase [Stachybotrys elegans]